MKKMTKFFAIISSICLLLATFVIFKQNIPQVSAEQAVQMTNIASYTDEEINTYNNVSWGLAQGSRSRITVDNKAYLKYVNAASYGKARLSLFAAEDRNWSDVLYYDIPVINNSSTGGVPILPFLFVDDSTAYGLLQSSGAAITGIQNGQSTTIPMDQGYIIIPAGFSGVLRIPVFADTAKYGALEGSTAWSLNNIQQIGFYFNDWMAVDVSMGDISIVTNEPVVTTTASSTSSTSQSTDSTTASTTQASTTAATTEATTIVSTTATTGSLKPSTGYITDIASLTQEEIDQYNNQSWGLPHGSRSRITVGGKAYLKYVNPAEYGKARLPVFAEEDQDWTTVTYIEFAVINNSSVKDMPVAPLFFLPGGTYYLLNQDSPLNVTGIQNGQSNTLIRDKGYILIPAGFEGVVRMPVSAQATDYVVVEGSSPWSLSDIEQIGFFFNDWGAVDISIGDIKRIIPVAEPGETTTTTAATAPSLKSGPVTDIANLTEEQLNEYNGVAWGMPQGSRRIVTVGGKTYLRYVNAAGAYGKARLPKLATEKRDWSNVTYVEFPVINNSSSKDAPILPFFNVDDNTYYGVSQTSGVLITGYQNGEIINIPMDKGYLLIPAGFKGTVRVPLSENKNNFAAIEGTTPWSLKNIQQIGFYFNDWGAVDISIGDISVSVKGGSVNTGDSGAGFVVIALMTVAMAVVLVSRKRKVC